MSAFVFYSLSTVCQYLKLYRLFVLCHYVHCCLLRPVHFLSVPHTLPSVCSVSLCPLLSSTACPLSVSTSHPTVCSVSLCPLLPFTVCQYLTFYRLLVLCPLLPFTVCPLSLSTSHCTFCLFCVIMSTAVFYSLSTVCHLTLYRLLSLCR